MEAVPTAVLTEEGGKEGKETEAEVEDGKAELWAEMDCEETAGGEAAG